jgi:hypothetical protein
MTSTYTARTCRSARYLQKFHIFLANSGGVAGYSGSQCAVAGSTRIVSGPTSAWNFREQRCQCPFCRCAHSTSLPRPLGPKRGISRWAFPTPRCVVMEPPIFQPGCIGSPICAANTGELCAAKIAGSAAERLTPPCRKRNKAPRTSSGKVNTDTRISAFRLPLDRPDAGSPGECLLRRAPVGADEAR